MPTSRQVVGVGPRAGRSRDPGAVRDGLDPALLGNVAGGGPPLLRDRGGRGPATVCRGGRSGGGPGREHRPRRRRRARSGQDRGGGPAPRDRPGHLEHRGLPARGPDRPGGPGGGPGDRRRRGHPRPAPGRGRRRRADLPGGPGRPGQRHCGRHGGHQRRRPARAALRVDAGPGYRCGGRAGRRHPGLPVERAGQGQHRLRPLAAPGRLGGDAGGRHRGPAQAGAGPRRAGGRPARARVDR